MRAKLLIAVLFAAGLTAERANAALPEPPAPVLSGTEQFLSAAWEPGPMVSPLAIQGATLSGFADRDSLKKSKSKKTKHEKVPAEIGNEGMTLGPERARILLQSLTVPGWGQATLGRRTAAGVFATVELGIWVAYASFRVQEGMRWESYRQTAMLGAGIDLRGRDEEFRRIVGSFISSDEYNLLVVSRDAANLYLRDVYNPNIEGYNAYIAENSLRGADAWNWVGMEAFNRYGAQRKDAQRAAINANSALGLAIANRIVSAIHAARAAGHPRTKASTWHFEVTPTSGDDATAYRAALSASF